MAGSKIVETIPITRIKNRKKTITEDNIINEDILKIYIDHNFFFEMVFSMTYPEALAAGFLFTQGVIQKRSDIQKINMKERERECHIFLNNKAKKRLESFNRSRKIKGSSGGTFLKEKTAQSSSVSNSDQTVTYDQILSLITMHQEYSGVFQQTGAVHSAGLCTPEKIIRFYEDIGRHNALDKLAGDTFLNPIDTHDKIATLSCRMSLEIISKIIQTEIPVVISNAAPTLCAVELADREGLTMIGFARDSRFNIYTHGHRVIR